MRSFQVIQRRRELIQCRRGLIHRKESIRHSDWSMIKETHKQPIKCEPWMSQQNLKICERNNGRRFK